MSAPPVVARDLRLVGGNGIVAIVDIEIVPWKLVFRGCRWRKDPAGERITLGACDCAGFVDVTIAQRFQIAALAAARALARKTVRHEP
jgi:hypothetical protein